MATIALRRHSRMADLSYSLAEFFGTFMFLLVAFLATQIAGVKSSDKPSDYAGPSVPNLMFIAFAFGFSLVVNCWVFFRASGGHLNPAWEIPCPWDIPELTSLGGRGCMMGISQILAGIAAAGVAKGLAPGHPVLFAVSLGGGASIAQGLFLEMFLTAQLVITVLLLAAEASSPQAPIAEAFVTNVGT
ncbi:hypothetical protein FGG08_004500 [Glutinoglossum americanum]|uniref:Aquaporin-like protein n=1 Tax=Glutinoglossum americanum TaxID=1670608 RepID=A0A9P8I262_9PEZI|nr:hypothetical protein FGG08_004500 [Glutinoglossum americanum]